MHSPTRGKCIPPAPSPSPEAQKTDPLSPETQKTENEKRLLDEIMELGGSGFRGSIRLVKLVWLVLPKKIDIGPKGPIYPKRLKKTLKAKIFHSHPCGFYIKNIAFPIEMAS